MAQKGRATLLHGILDEVVEKEPGRLCLQMGDHAGLTYEEVKSASIGCASFVCGLGKAGATVLICADRSYGMLVCMLGAMRAGSAYCPVEPDYPQSRLASMLEVADMKYCLTPASQTPQELIAHFPEITTLAVKDNGDSEFVGSSEFAMAGPLADEFPDSFTAYVLFTSGSTGKPKGCMVPHRGSALYAHAVVDSCELDGSMTYLLKTPYVFDVSIQDIYTAFSAGGKLVIAEPNLHKDAAALAELVSGSKINCMAFTPTLLVEFVNHLALNPDVTEKVGKSLRRVLTIGEALMAATCKQLFGLLPALDGQLHNLYGPTEASVGVSHFRVSSASLGDGAVVRIGKPFDYVVYKVFDPARYDGKAIAPDLLVDVPPGETGELFIGGDCLAQGYMRDEARTGAAFFHFPEVLARPSGAASQFSLYKTGDLVRCGSDGVFEIFGRTDFQVKVGGVRIECEEISAVLKEHRLIDDALVTAFEGPFGKALAAYVVSNGGAWIQSHLEESREDGRGASEGGEVGSDCDTDSGSDEEAEMVRSATQGILEMQDNAACNKELQSWITTTSLLPVMRPRVYILLAAFPKNTAGKVDRGSLPSAREAFDALVSSGSEQLVPPETDEERLMAECWERVLGMQISMETPFSAYGGHSLTALALRSEISKQFGSFPDLAVIMAEDGTPRKLLEDIHLSKVVEDTGEVKYPFVIPRTISTLFHFDSIEPSVYSASHRAARALPQATKTLMYAEFVPSLELEFEQPVADLPGLVASLLEAHPILRARYDLERRLVIQSPIVKRNVYFSWNSSLDDVRYGILAFYNCPLFHLIGHRKGAKDTQGPAVRIAVAWSHVIQDAYSARILKRDIMALARGEKLKPTNLRAYLALADNPLAKPIVVKQHPFPPFSLPKRQRRFGWRALRNKIVNTIRIMVAVSHREFESDMDRLHFFLNAFCAVSGQSRGRFGLVTNARAKVNVDASSLVGALIYNAEYSYDSATGELKALGNACDARSGVGFNMHDTFAGMELGEALSELGIKRADKVAQGNVKDSVVRSATGVLGANFADGEGFYVECLPVAGATIFRGMYPDALLKAKSMIQALQQRLSGAGPTKEVAFPPRTGSGSSG